MRNPQFSANFCSDLAHLTDTLVWKHPNTKGYYISNCKYSNLLFLANNSIEYINYSTVHNFLTNAPHISAEIHRNNGSTPIKAPVAAAPCPCNPT